VDASSIFNSLHESGTYALAYEDVRQKMKKAHLSFGNVLNTG